jgi:uncharacterized lipoprotein
MKIINICLLSLLLTSCALVGIRNRDSDYKQSQTTPYLTIPKNISPANVDQYHRIPATSGQAQKNELIVPPGQSFTETEATPKNIPLSGNLITNAESSLELQITGNTKAVYANLKNTLSTLKYSVIGTDTKNGLISFKTNKGNNYQLSIADADPLLLVTLITSNGDPADNSTAKIILTALQKGLRQ